MILARILFGLVVTAGVIGGAAGAYKKCCQPIQLAGGLR